MDLCNSLTCVRLVWLVRMYLAPLLGVVAMLGYVTTTDRCRPARHSTRERARCPAMCMCMWPPAASSSHDAPRHDALHDALFDADNYGARLDVEPVAVIHPRRDMRAGRGWGARRGRTLA